MRKVSTCLCVSLILMMVGNFSAFADTFDDAKTLYEQGEYDQVISALSEFARENPADSRSEEAEFIAINSRYALKQYDQFKQEKAAFLTAHPNSELRADLEFQENMMSYHQGNWNDAELKLKTFARDYPDSPLASRAAYYGLASLWNGKKYPEFKQSVADFEQAHPDYPEIDNMIFNKAYLGIEEGKWEEAADSFNAFQTKYPKSHLIPNALYYEATSLWNTKAYAEFKTVVSELEDKYPDYPDFYDLAFSKAYLNIEKGEWNEAAADFETFPAKYPDSHLIERAAYYHAYCLSNTKRYQEFNEAFDTFKAKYPENQELHNLVFQKAHHHYDEGEYAEAVNMLETFEAQYPESELVPEANYYSAMSRYEGHQYDQFKSKCTEFMKKYPENDLVKEIQYHDALASYKLMDYAASHKLLETFIAEHPESDMALSAKLYCAMSLANEIIALDEKSDEYSEKSTILHNYLNLFRSGANELLGDENIPAHLRKRLSYEYVESFYYERDYDSLAQAATDLLSQGGIDKTTQCFALNWLAIALLIKDERDLAGGKKLLRQVIETDIPYDQWGIELKSSAARWLSYAAHESDDLEDYTAALSAAQALPDCAEKAQIVAAVESHAVNE